MQAPQPKAPEDEADSPPESVVWTFNSSNQARGHFIQNYKLILLAGALSSGKTALHPLALKRRGRRKRCGTCDHCVARLDCTRFRGAAETNQLGSIFTNTKTTLDAGVFTEISKHFRLLGEPQPVYGHKPPLEWVRQWVRDGTEIPPVASYRHILTTPDGVHVLCGTLSTIKASHQYETMQVGWARLEETINNELATVETITERVRCLTGGDSDPECALFHFHNVHWIFNPPRGAHRWLYAKLDQLEDAARNHYHALRDDETCDGCSYIDEERQVFCRAHGPHLEHRKWPLLQQGIGDAIWIRSRTSDNAPNQNRGYRAGLAANMSKTTALRRLEGEIIRETGGRAYGEFGDANVRPVGYDADRVLYVGLDFNLTPRAAVFAQPLNPGSGEYPTENERQGVSHLGVFGEYFFAGEMDDRRFALELAKGGRGDGLELQPRYRSEEWRGLPPPCDDECVEEARAAYSRENPGRPGRINYERDLARAIATCRKGHWNGLKGHRGSIGGFGDQRGTHRTAAADNLGSSWVIVDKVFLSLGNYGRSVPEVQPSPRSRVDVVNGKFLNIDDVRSLWIDPRCEELIRDFEQVMWDDDGQSLREWRQGIEILRTHLSDALGYMIHQLFGDGDVGLDAVETTLERKQVERRRTTYPLKGRR